MDKKLLAAQLASIELQLRMIRAQLAKEDGEPPRRFSDLKGIWKGKTNFSYEEIKEAEIKVS